MTVLRGCHVFRLPYAFLKPNVNIRPSENRFARFCETKTDCRKTKRQRQPENRILGFRLPCCLSLQQLYFSPRRAKIPKLKSSRNVYLLIKKLHLVSWRGGDVQLLGCSSWVQTAFFAFVLNQIQLFKIRSLSATRITLVFRFLLCNLSLLVRKRWCLLCQTLLYTFVEFINNILVFC